MHSSMFKFVPGPENTSDDKSPMDLMRPTDIKKEREEEELKEVGAQDPGELPRLGREWLGRGSACFRPPSANRTGAARLPAGWES